MKLRSADDDLQQVPAGSSRGLLAALVDMTGRWSTDRTDQGVSVLTIVNVTRLDAGLFVCYCLTPYERSAFHVFRLVIIDDRASIEGVSAVVRILFVISCQLIG